MKTKFSAALLAILFLGVTAMGASANPFLSVLPANSGWKNITVFDGQSKPGNNGWYGTREDNEVEWGMGTNGRLKGAAKLQIFDLEAMYYNSEAKQLMIIGGYDFSKFPETHAGHTVEAGDIFLNAGSKNYVLDITYPIGNQTSGSYNTSYDLYSGNFITAPTNYIVSSPDYKRRFGGDFEGIGGVAFFHDIYSQNSVWNGIANTFAGDRRYNKHHALVVDVSWLENSGIDSFDAYHTMQCGNDVIQGSVKPGSTVPEPASFFLFGTGLLFFAHRYRRD